MKNISILREYIRIFVGSNQITTKNKIPYGANREQIGSLGDADDCDEEISDHLKFPDEIPDEQEDVYGPVPPSDHPNFYVTNDPYTRDYFVLPTKPIYR
jgi:hypothetical protein